MAVQTLAEKEWLTLDWKTKLFWVHREILVFGIAVIIMRFIRFRTWGWPTFVCPRWFTSELNFL